MTKTPFRNKIKSSVVLAFSCILLSSLYSLGYVMPAEQILDFMVKNFIEVRTVTLVQSTLQTAGGSEKVFTEQLWFESPDMYSTKVLDKLGEREIIVPDLLYRQLFLANSSERIERMLKSLGIDLTKTSYMRLDGVIAFRIGGKETDSPKLIVEKNRFLPLMLVYKVPQGTGNLLITVRFEDYQKKDKGWYPFQITYKSGDGLVEKYTIQTFQENISVDPSILKRFPEYVQSETPEPSNEAGTAGPDPVNTDKKRLQNVLKAYEEQYQ